MFKYLRIRERKNSHSHESSEFDYLNREISPPATAEVKNKYMKEERKKWMTVYPILYDRKHTISHHSLVEPTRSNLWKKKTQEINRPWLRIPWCPRNTNEDGAQEDVGWLAMARRELMQMRTVGQPESFSASVPTNAHFRCPVEEPGLRKASEARGQEAR